MTDFSKILDKAKELESKMKDSQEKIKNIRAEGISGGDAVKITLNGDGEIVNLHISQKIFNEDSSYSSEKLIENIFLIDIELQKESNYNKKNKWNKFKTKSTLIRNRKNRGKKSLNKKKIS